MSSSLWQTFPGSYEYLNFLTLVTIKFYKSFNIRTLLKRTLIKTTHSKNEWKRQKIKMFTFRKLKIARSSTNFVLIPFHFLKKFLSMWSDLSRGPGFDHFCEYFPFLIGGFERFIPWIVKKFTLVEHPNLLLIPFSRIDMSFRKY